MSMKSVLVVEDDHLNMHLISLFLRAHGYRPHAARDGVSALESFRRNDPDMMIVDVQLPRKNGFEVCFDVKRTEHGRNTPVLLMSAVYTDREHAERYSSDLHADGYFVKPFDMNHLLERVRELIG